MRHFIFNGKDSRDFFTFISAIERPYLPPITVPSVKIPNRAGAVSLKKNDIEVREIKIRVVLMALNDGELRTKIRTLADFLIYEEDKDLYFSDEPNRVYKARFNQSSTDLEELAHMGEGELAFTCFDPFAYSNALSSANMEPAQEITITNGGTLETFPLFRVVPGASVPLIKLINVTTNKRFIYNATWPMSTALIIDMEKNIVYQESNGERFMVNVALESEFFSLQPGANRIRIETFDDGTANITSSRIEWRNRYY